MTIVVRTPTARAQGQLLYFLPIVGKPTPVAGQMIFEYGTFVLPSNYLAGGFMIDFSDFFRQIRSFDAAYISGLPAYPPNRFEWSAADAVVTVKLVELTIGPGSIISMAEPIGKNRSSGSVNYQLVGW